MFRVSVIIPTHNSAPFLGEAIESVLRQTYPNIEIIVVDDGSTDNTQSVLQEYLGRIECVYQENQGVSAARNAGLRRSQGDLLAFLDADDIWLPNKVELQLAFLSQQQEVALAFGDVEVFGQDGVVAPSFLARTTLGPKADGDGTILRDGSARLLSENFIVTSTVVIRREILCRAGEFDESLRSVEDRDLWMRIARAAPIGCLPQLLARKRIHARNLSADDATAAHSRIRVFQKWIDDPYIRESFDSASLRRLMAQQYFELGYARFEKGEYRAARQSCIHSLALKLDVRPLKCLLASYLGQRRVARIRSLRSLKRPLEM